MRNRFFPGFALISLFLVIAIIIFSISFQEDTTAAPKVPIMYLTLAEASTDDLLSAPKDQTYDLSSLELNASGTITTYQNLTIKGHGNSTWAEDKKPFQIKFSTKTSLFGFKKAKKYLLLANNFDASNLKNAVALELENMLNQNFSLSGEYVDLYINGDYQGLYFLTEKIELGKNRIQLSSQSAILVEHEGLHSHLEDYCYETTDSACLVVKDINDPALESDAMASFLQKYSELESAAKSSDYAKIQELIDVDSFAKYYLLSDFTLNPDAYMSSYFFYQNGPEDKIHLGPGWDFDLSFSTGATQDLNYGIDIFSPYSTGADRAFYGEDVSAAFTTRAGLGESGESESLIMYYLIRIPEFKARVQELYMTYLYGHVNDLLAFINNLIDQIRDSAILNNEKWEREDFDTAADRLKSWVHNRYDYLESYYANRPAIDSSQILAL